VVVVVVVVVVVLVVVMKQWSDTNLGSFPQSSKRQHA